MVAGEVKGRLAGLSLLGLVLVLSIWAATGSEQLRGESVASNAVVLPDAGNIGQRPTPTLPTPIPGNEAPPNSALLAGNAAKQAAYDAEAEPGEFVTPPNISIEH